MLVETQLFFLMPNRGTSNKYHNIWRTYGEIRNMSFLVKKKSALSGAILQNIPQHTLLMSHSTSRAPRALSCNANSLPIPCPAPVTRINFPVTLLGFFFTNQPMTASMYVYTRYIRSWIISRNTAILSSFLVYLVKMVVWYRRLVTYALKTESRTLGTYQ